MNNSSGKVLVIFLIITGILLISLTAISLFFFQKETERRKLAEVTLKEYQSEKDGLEVELKEINWINKPKDGVKYGARIRYRQPLQECTISGDVVTFEDPQLPAPGQSCVIYKGEQCLGGGIIR